MTARVGVKGVIIGVSVILLVGIGATLVGVRFGHGCLVAGCYFAGVALLGLAVLFCSRSQEFEYPRCRYCGGRIVEVVDVPMEGDNDNLPAHMQGRKWLFTGSQCLECERTFPCLANTWRENEGNSKDV